MFQKKLKPLWARHQKRWFGKWHLYLGIIAGFILSVVGVTGSILVFQDEIDHALNPALFTVLEQKHRLEIENVLPLIKKKHSQIKFSFISTTDDSPTSTYRVYDTKSQKEIFFNPYNAEICGKRLINSSFISIVTSIHRTLLIPVAGRYIVGLSALCLLILTISGLRLWIPQKWAQLKSVLTINFNAGFKRQNYDWHNVLGVYSTPVVSLLALTGFCITFSTLIVPLLFILNGKSPQGVAQLFSVKSEYKKGIKPLPVQQIANIGRSKFPKSSLEFISMPQDSVGIYSLDFKTSDINKAGKRELLLIDQYTGKIFLNSRNDFPNIGQAYLSWLTPIHYGSFGGIPTKVLAIIAGLIPLALFITGFIIWWPRYRKQKNKRRKKTPEKLKQKNGLYFKLNLNYGFRYALITLLVVFLCGALYGLVSGVILQPAIFGIVFLGVLTIINFLIALIAGVFNLIFLLPFKRGYQPILKYFTLSLTFVLVFIPIIVFINLTGVSVF